MISIPAHVFLWLPVLVLGFYLACIVIVNYILERYLKVFLIVLAMYVYVHTNMHHTFTSFSDLLISLADQTSIGWTIVAFILPFWRGVMKSFLQPVWGMVPHSFTSSVIYVLLEVKAWTLFPVFQKLCIQPTCPYLRGGHISRRRHSWVGVHFSLHLSM